MSPLLLSVFPCFSSSSGNSSIETSTLLFATSLYLPALSRTRAEILIVPSWIAVIVCKYGGFDVSIWSYSIISIGVSIIVGMIVSLMTQSQLPDEKTLNEATINLNKKVNV